MYMGKEVAGVEAKKKRITLKTKSSPKLCKFLLLHNKCFPLKPTAGCLLREVCLDHIFFPFKPL